MSRLLSATCAMFLLAGCAAAGSSTEGEEATAKTSSDALVSCGWLAGGDCSELPDGDWTTPEFWGDHYLKKYASELQNSLDNIEPGPTPLAQPRTVLLITGVTIKAEFFDPIAKRLKRDGFNPVVWEPPALLSGSLFDAANDLGNVIDNLRAQTGQDQIDVLAECTGGLITRYYLEALGGDQKVSRLVTFISPEHGIPILRWIAPFVGWQALYDLTPGSDFLDAVDSMPLPSNVPMTSIYTCTDEYIQPFSTSIVDGATNVGVCDQGFVGHYQFFWDPNLYLMMHDALVQ